MSWQFINPEHKKLWDSMERVSKTIADKGLTEYKSRRWKYIPFLKVWKQEDPTLRAIRNNKPLDYYWSERFKGWDKWPTRFVNDGKNDFI